MGGGRSGGEPEEGLKGMGYIFLVLVIINSFEIIGFNTLCIDHSYFI